MFLNKFLNLYDLLRLSHKMNSRFEYVYSVVFCRQWMSS